jgi:hypothetical protein
LSLANLVTGQSAIPFSIPKFDPSLGSLQSVDFALDFSGTVVGSANGVSESSSMFSTITHSVFFDFEDYADRIGIAEPTLSLIEGIPAGAQNTTIAFGPTFQSTDLSFSVTSRDLRLAAFGNGPGNLSGTLAVWFTNTSMNAWGLQFFPGYDSGVYSGSFSVAYSYEPVPEPCGLALGAVGLLLVCARTRAPEERQV